MVLKCGGCRHNHKDHLANELLEPSDVGKIVGVRSCSMFFSARAFTANADMFSISCVPYLIPKA